jgi:hypothetical protein
MPQETTCAPAAVAREFLLSAISQNKESVEKVTPLPRMMPRLCA